MFQVFQLFHLDVAKTYLDVAYVAMVVHVCCKFLFQCFSRFSRCILQVCLFGCYICFTYMLQNVLSGCCVCLTRFSSVFRCFCKCFICMF
jgi:hypothetical protein